MTSAAVAGVDTISHAWRCSDRLLDQIRRRYCDDSRSLVLPDKVAEHRLGVMPEKRLLWAEGHPGGDGVLCPAAGLPGYFERLVEQLHAAGIEVPTGLSSALLPGREHSPPTEGYAGVRRLDATADLPFQRSAEGLAFAAGVAAVARDAPRSKADVIFSADGARIETVYLRGLAGRAVLGRMYDKGVESGTAPPGRRMRLEDQRRFRADGRRHPGELSARFVRGRFEARFLPLWRASKGVK